MMKPQPNYVNQDNSHYTIKNIPDNSYLAQQGEGFLDDKYYSKKIIKVRKVLLKAY